MFQNKDNFKKELIITLDLLKNQESLIKKLESSLYLQKLFLKDIDNKLSSFLKNKGNNKNETLLIEELLSILPEIISQLGIPFVYHFLNQEKILEKFLNLYYDQYDEKVEDIFKTCLNIVSFSLYCDYFNKIKHSLIEIGIIQNKEEYTNKNSDMNPEQIIFERISSMLNELNQLKDIGIDKENISKFEIDYNDVIKEIKNLHNKMNITPAMIEFYQELIKPFGDYLKSMSKTIKNKKKEENTNKENINNNNDENIIKNNEIDEIKGISLDKRTFFYKDEKIKENRNQVIEFKNYSFPLNEENSDEIKRHLCSFLNSEGGRLYIGIDEKNIVKGITLNYKKRDNLRNSLVNLTYDFYPKCRVDKIFVYFIPIKDPKTKNFIQKKYIIKIRVYPGDPQVLYSMTNKGGYHSTIRRNGQCKILNSTEIYEEIIHRDKYKKVLNDEKNQMIMKENEIKDPEPEVNQQDLEDNEIDDIPVFKKIIIEKGNNKNNAQKKNNGKPKKNIKEGPIVVKVTNIDKDLPLNDVNRTFNNCKCSSQHFLKAGYGYLNFSNQIDAENCIVNFDGRKLGNKKIKLSIVKNNA